MKTPLAPLPASLYYDIALRKGTTEEFSAMSKSIHWSRTEVHWSTIWWAYHNQRLTNAKKS